MCTLCRVGSQIIVEGVPLWIKEVTPFWRGCEVFSQGEQAWCSSLCPCSYFAVVVYKVLVLLVEELGGSNAFLTRFSGKPFRINTGPCCCCCMCLPRVPMSRYLHHHSLHTLTVLLLRLFPCFSAHRRMLFWLKIGALQYAILKTVLSIFSVVLWTNGNFDLSNVRKYFNSEKCRNAIWILKHIWYSL